MKFVLTAKTEYSITLGPGNNHELEANEKIEVPEGYHLFIEPDFTRLARFGAFGYGYAIGNGLVKMCVLNLHRFRDIVVAQGDVVAHGYLVKTAEKAEEKK